MKWLLFTLLTVLATPVAATQDGWPAVFDVTGVAANDVLNIRSGPSAGAEIIGHLAADATGVEVIRPDDRESWGLVNVGEGVGWVSLRFLERRPGQWAGGFPNLRSCFGTEPFWRLTRDGSTLGWSTPEAGPVSGDVVDDWSSSTRRDRHALAGRFDDGTEILAMIRGESCSDFMSDREFGLAIDMIHGGPAGGAIYSGCCTLSD